MELWPDASPFDFGVANAIGEATRMIQDGRADVMIAGGSEAPISGLIGDTQAPVGGMVTPNAQQPLTTIVPLDPVWVRFKVSEAQHLYRRQAEGLDKLRRGLALRAGT